MTAHTDTEITFDSLAFAWDYPVDAIVAWADNQHMSPEEAADFQQDFEDSFMGEMTMQEYAEELVDQYAVPEFILPYVDIDAVARDLRYDGFWEGSGYLFRW